MSWPPPSSDPRLAVAAAVQLEADAIENRLDDALDPVLSSRRTATAVAQSIACLERPTQDFILHWVCIIARTNAEMAYQFAASAPTALKCLDLSAAEAWIIQAMDTYDREGLYRGSAVFKNVDTCTLAHDGSSPAVAFDEAVGVLRYFLHGLDGRTLQLDVAERPYTDTEIVFLPPRIAFFQSRAHNFLAYKVMTTLMWAQVRYGTFNLELQPVCNAFPDPGRATELLGQLETMRLEARLTRILPGLARDMAALRHAPVVSDPRSATLLDQDATIADSVAVLGRVYEDLEVAHQPYAPELRPDLAAAVRRARIAREKVELQTALANLSQEQSCAAGPGNDPHRLKSEAAASADATVNSLDHRLDGVSLPAEITRLLHSIEQDLGEIPDDYLTPAGDGGYRQRTARPEHDDPLAVWRGVYHEQGAYFYNEWDYGRKHFRKNWCVLREMDVHPGDPAFVTATLARYASQVSQLKRTFELLRGEDRLLKRQPGGDDIDLDAVVGAYADMHSGLELTDRLHVRRHKTERDLAVMFMIDMSGSTKGWINDAEREALVMLCEALEVLGDRYAIYGFSGITRKRCEAFRIKRFDEPYDIAVKSRIAGIRPQDYTRMGVAIRHLSMRLGEIEARTKLLITLSDGKPDDYSDNYRGEYGIEDTRHALVEAQHSGIKAFCITIDSEARDYLPHMYGPVNWTLVADVGRLPLKVADIYRRLTA